MTQAKFASDLGVRQQTLARWESGHAPQRRYWELLMEVLALGDPEEVGLLLRPIDRHDNVVVVSFGGRAGSLLVLTSRQQAILDSLTTTILERTRSGRKLDAQERRDMRMIARAHGLGEIFEIDP